MAVNIFCITPQVESGITYMVNGQVVTAHQFGQAMDMHFLADLPEGWEEFGVLTTQHDSMALGE
jgi:hypothetical protein